MKWQRELDLAVSAVQSAAACLGSRFVSGAGVCSLEGKDIKTDADVEAEAEILRHLRVTAFPIVAEESSAARVGGSGVHWLVDPLDGTMNFARGFPMHAISVALWDGMTPLLGAIYDLPRRALYTGVIGSGAWRDGRPIVVSDTAEKSQAILATGFATGREYGSGALGDFIARVQAFKKIRMIGSATLSLAMVSGGTFDAYFEEDIMLWDVAAGIALVAAAGGTFEVWLGNRPNAVVAFASNGRITLN